MKVILGLEQRFRGFLSGRIVGAVVVREKVINILSKKGNWARKNWFKIRGGE